MSFCSNCGAPLADGARFCASCGAPVQAAGPAPAAPVPSEPDPAEGAESVNYTGKEVKLCTDGKYRWTYPMNMYKNPTIFFTVCKIFGILGAAMFVLLNIGSALNGDFDLIAGTLKYWGIAIVVFLVIALISYLIVAAMYSGRYIVNFTMDEEGLLHEQIPAQKKNARIIGGAVAAGGVLSGNVGRVGQGAAVAVHTSLSSDFAKVKRIKAYRGRSTILVNQPFAKNQVYTTREDFDFVLGFIRDHCPKAK